MGHIFISYSHKDRDYVHKLQEALQKEGFDVWIDDRIKYGSEWPKVVTTNLDASDGVVVVLSNNSYESDMVQNEVARAREKKKPIFPLLLDGENWLIVQTKQFVDVKGGLIPAEKFYRRLEEITTRRKIEKLNVAPPPQVNPKVVVRNEVKKSPGLLMLGGLSLLGLVYAVAIFVFLGVVLMIAITIESSLSSNAQPYALPPKTAIIFTPTLDLYSSNNVAPSPSFEMITTETPAISSTSTLATSNYTAILETNGPTEGNATLKLSFTANLQSPSGDLVCSGPQPCSFTWVVSKYGVEVLRSTQTGPKGSFSYSFGRGSYIVQVIVCQNGCVYAGVNITAK